MYVYGDLKYAQAHLLAADPSPGKKGLFWFNTDTNLLKYDDGTNVRVLVNTAEAQTLTSKTLTSPVLATSARFSYATASTVPYFDSNKDLISSATTPTQLGYLASATGTTGTASTNLVFSTSPTITTPTFATSTTFSYATATTVPYWDGSKNLVSSAVTPTELGYVSGVTSAIQTQMNLKAPLASPTFTGTVTLPSGSVTSSAWTFGTSTFGGSGLVSLTGALSVKAGSVGAPSIYFGASDTTTGPYTSATNAISWAFNGVRGITWSFGAYTFRSDASAAGTACALTATHADNTNAASHMRVVISTGGASGGDPILYINNAVKEYYIGLDNSASDTLCFGVGDTPGALDVIKMTFGGLITLGASGGTEAHVLNGHLAVQNAGEVRFHEGSSGANYVGFKAAASLSADKVWVLPTADGTTGQVLKTDGSGNLGWVSVSSSATSLVAAYRNSSSQSCSAGTPTELVFQVERFDSQSEYSTSTGRFTATAAGYYRVSFGLTILAGATAPTSCAVYMLVNGTGSLLGYQNTDNWTVNNKTYHAGGSYLINLTAGQYVSLWISSVGQAVNMVHSAGSDDISWMTVDLVL